MMSLPIYLVTVNSTPEKATDLVATVINDLKAKYSLVHVANCETIPSVKTLLTSLITPPHLLITTSEWFEEEQEEIREIAQRIVPGTHLIMIPSGLKAQEGDKAVVEYLREQVTESKLPVRP